MLSGIAKVCLEKGNKEYRQGEANNAINSYTEGLQVNCKDKRLNAKLYSNRATAHFRLGNNFISKYINISCSVTRQRNTQSTSKKGENCRKKAWKEISPFSRSKLSKEMILVDGLQFMQLEFF